MAEQQWTLVRRTEANDLKRYRRTWRADRSALGTPCVPRERPRVGRAAFSRGPYFRKGIYYDATQHKERRRTRRPFTRTYTGRNEHYYNILQVL